MAAQTNGHGIVSRPLSESNVTTWHPFSILTPDLLSKDKFALIALNQPLSLPPAVYSILWGNAHTRIGADGGANRVYKLNTTFSSTGSTNTINGDSNEKGVEDGKLKLPLDTIIGDLDSITPKVRKYWESRGTDIIHVPDQDSTDFTKAVEFIRSPPTASQPFHGASLASGNGDNGVVRGNREDKSWDRNTDIVVLGGLGGRVDQGMSVLHHLYMFQTSSSPSPASNGPDDSIDGRETDGIDGAKSNGPDGNPSTKDYAAGKIYLLSTTSITFLLLPGTHRIHLKPPPTSLYPFSPSPPSPHLSSSSPTTQTTTPSIKLGKHIGIIPLLGPSTITTRGLEWDVTVWKTQFGGQMSTSNWVRDEWVEVTTDRGVLFTVDLEVRGMGEEWDGE